MIPSLNDRCLRSADGWSRRKGAIADRVVVVAVGYPSFEDCVLLMIFGKLLLACERGLFSN
jgi:hypothetical protein